MARNIAYQIRSRLASSNDGSGKVLHEMEQVWRDDAAQPNDPWTVVPGYHKFIGISSLEVKAVMDLPTQGQIVGAYKVMLDLHITDSPYTPPNKAWGDEAEIQRQLDENDASGIEAVRVNDFVTITLGKTFPIQFELPSSQ